MIKKILIAIFALLCFTVGASAQETSTDSSEEDIRDKVQEKVDKVISNPQFYLGSITDLTENTIQINRYKISSTDDNGGSEIQQISAKDITTYVKIFKTTTNIKYSDLAIGDFIIAMGYKNGNNVLDARRILVVEALKPTTRTNITGIVDKIEKKLITLKTDDGKLYNLLTSKDTKISKSSDDKDVKLTDISENDRLIVSGTLENDNLTTRSIKLIEPPSNE